MDTVVSGIRPTGNLHLGNYFGAVRAFTQMQNEYNCFFFIADWHSLTTHHEIDHYGPGSGFPLNSLYNGGLTVTSDNEVYIAGMNGMVSFAEDKLAGNLPPFTLHFSQL